MIARYRPPKWPTRKFVRAIGTPAARNLGRPTIDMLEDINARLARVNDAGNAIAQEATAHAKKFAPWKDRTGAARRNLRVTFLNFGRYYVLQFAHGVYYGKYLEYRWGGRFAILRPTAQIYTPRLRDRIRRIFRRAAGAPPMRQVIDTSSAFDPQGRRSA